MPAQREKPIAGRLDRLGRNSAALRPDGVTRWLESGGDATAAAPHRFSPPPVSTPDPEGVAPDAPMSALASGPSNSFATLCGPSQPCRSSRRLQSSGCCFAANPRAGHWRTKCNSVTTVFWEPSCHTSVIVHEVGHSVGLSRSSAGPAEAALRVREATAVQPPVRTTAPIGAVSTPERGGHVHLHRRYREPR